MYETIRTLIVGIAPMIQHNVRLADPADKIVRALKEITNKGSKNMTEADYLQHSKLQFMGGLYLGDNGPILPAHMIEATLIKGAMKSKKGPQAKAGMIVDKHADLIYDGPRNPEELFEDDRFRFTTMVRVQKNMVTSTRPIFREWSAEIEIKHLPDVINERDIMTAIRNAGALCGFGDWKPRHGRFALASDMQQQESVKMKDAA